MFDNGYLDSDDSFQRHFITVPRKFDVLCSACNREMYAVEGMDMVCPHCKQTYKWDESGQRFYPQMQRL